MEIQVIPTFKVEIIESERGWGQRIDEVKYFNSAKSAQDFCEDFNRKNTAQSVPDWYMYANYVGRVL